MLLLMAAVTLSGQPAESLPRKEAPRKVERAFNRYLSAVEKSGLDLHSIMILQDGKVLEERWLGEGAPDRPHILNSVSKTFTAMAVGFAAEEGRLDISDKVISFFPDELPEEMSVNLMEMEVRDLLTMSCGHESDPSDRIMEGDAPWTKAFLETPVTYEPGTFFCYNSVGTYMLSAIIQKVTGEKLMDYLTPRLFEPLGIKGAFWEESPQGINTGGLGLYLKTEDLAKMGQFILQKGRWNGKQLISEGWIEEMTSYQVASNKASIKVKPKDSDWHQGYGYQMWLCRFNAFRAAGKHGQFIIIIPEKNAVIAMTAHIKDMKTELDMVWEYLYKAL